MKADQLLISGFVTERSIISNWYRTIGKLGGSARTPKQIAAHRRSARHMNEVLAMRRAKKGRAL